MLTDAMVEQILGRAPGLRVGVLGDLFLDRYLDLDARLTEPSIETGLDAYQVVRVRSYPGAAGTVINNLAALGVGRIYPIAYVGDDGEGYELRQALAKLSAVDPGGIVSVPDRRTPTYTKPMLGPEELNRLDIKNRRPLPADAEADVIRSLDAVWPTLDALLVLDQVSEPDCGVVTRSVRGRIAQLAAARPGRFVLADSRERVGLFENVCLKPNERECATAIGQADGALALARRCGRAVFLTRGEQGMAVADPVAETVTAVRAWPVSGPTDTVGAGDSTSAALACAIASGASPVAAAAFGNLVASITIQQIGTTGTATPEQVRARWREVRTA
jgi:rfaE bifunctional protein kinase chain/domain